MASPLAGSLATSVFKAMRGLFLDATLTRDVEGTITDPADPPAPTPTPYDCKAIVETYAERFRLDGTVHENDRKVLILANSLSVTPKAGDRVSIRSITFTIQEVMTDPAIAVWECRGRM